MLSQASQIKKIHTKSPIFVLVSKNLPLNVSEFESTVKECLKENDPCYTVLHPDQLNTYGQFIETLPSNVYFITDDENTAEQLRNMAFIVLYTPDVVHAKQLVQDLVVRYQSLKTEKEVTTNDF